MPDDDQLGRLAAAVQEAVAQRIAFAERTIGAAAGGQPHDVVSYAHPAAPVPSNASDDADGFTISSYAGGRPARVPAVPRRRWVVLRALNFRVRIDDFLVALASVRGETELPAAALYVDLAAQERWVAVWWVQTNVTIRLGDLEKELVARASELAHRQPNQVPAHLISPFATAWQELGSIDDSGAMGGLPPPTAHNAYRVDGSGPDATLRHGAWAIFALMLLPAVTVEDKLTVGPGERVTVPIADVTPLVDEDTFERRLGVGWRTHAAELSAERAGRLRSQALEKRQLADVTEAGDPSRARRATSLRQAAQDLEEKANALTGRAGELRAAAGGGVHSVIPTSEEVERAIDALESGTSPGGGPQAWVRIAAEDADLAKPEVVERLTRSLFRSRTGNRVVFRVQGGTGTDTSWDFVHVGELGSVRIATGGNALNLNFGVYERAVEYLLEHRPGGELVVFEVEEGWFSALRGIATPERGEGARLVVEDPVTGAKQPGVAPKITDVTNAPRTVDVTKGVDQIQIPDSLLHQLDEFIVPGSGRKLQFTP